MTEIRILDLFLYVFLPFHIGVIIYLVVVI